MLRSFLSLSLSPMLPPLLSYPVVQATESLRAISFQKLFSLSHGFVQAALVAGSPVEETRRVI